MTTITLIPWGGLANRMKAISSMLAYCEDKGAKLEVVWFRNRELNASFETLFEDIEGADIREARKLDFYLLTHPHKSNLYIPRIYQPLVFDKIITMSQCAEIKDHHCLLHRIIRGNEKVYVNNCYAIYDTSNISRIFIPRQKIKDDIESVVSEKFGSRTVGIHIRRTDNIASKEKSTTDMFIESIDKEISLNSDVKVYLASDSASEKDTLVQKFGDRIITLDGMLNRTSDDGISFAVKELFLLSKTDKIYGSFGSSFSETAAQIGGVELEMLKK